MPAARSLTKAAKQCLSFIVRVSNDAHLQDEDWTYVFRDHYDVLRMLIDARMRIDGIESTTHQCAFAYICHKHPALALDWEFLEEIRQLRNAINYRGLSLGRARWQALEGQIRAHITSMMDHLDDALSAQ